MWPLLDEARFVDVDEALRVERRVARHVQHGKAPEAARRWTLGPDQANALLVQVTRVHADLVVRCGHCAAGPRALRPCSPGQELQRLTHHRLRGGQVPALGQRPQ